MNALKIYYWSKIPLNSAIGRVNSVASIQTNNNAINQTRGGYQKAVNGKLDSLYQTALLIHP